MESPASDSIPFENLESFEEGRIPSLDTQDLYTKIVVCKRGGYCFELNKLFYELIKTLGFMVYPLGVRIPWNKAKTSAYAPQSNAGNF